MVSHWIKLFGEILQVIMEKSYRLQKLLKTCEMKTSQVKEKQLSSNIQKKGQIIVKCIKDQLAIHACINTDCNKYSFVCGSTDCQCNLQHSLCSLIVIKNLVRVIRNKAIDLKPIEQTIQIQFNKMIDKISDIKDCLINKCQQSFPNYLGLQSYQSDFLHALQTQKTKDIRGKDIFKIQMNIKSQTKKRLNFKKSHQIINDLIKKLYVEVEQIKKHILDEFDRMTNQRDNLFQSSLIKTYEQEKIIQGFFPDKKIKSSKLLYRATENNFAINQFHSKCNGKNNILVICETQFGKLLGCYTPLNWSQLNIWTVDHTKQSFLYSLTKNAKFSQVDTTNTILMHPSYGPYFGCSPDLSIIDQANTNNSSANFSASFKNSSYPGNSQNTNLQILGSVNNTFKLKQWQVFQLEFE